MKKYRMLQFFCGIGGKGLGAKASVARFGEHEASFETVGGIDNDPLACRDFEMLVGAPTLCVDVHELEPEQLRAFAGDEAPDAVMMSPPCKGFSALLSAKKAKEPQYEKMNRLMLRALFLCCATWDRPPKLIFVENVPLIQSRGREIVRQSVAIGEAHGYAIVRGTHDCGELGGLAQHRPRWFMVWRHREQVPGLLYQPPKKRVRACGEVLGPLPIPGDVEAGGPMHSVPKLWWRNWLRLAEIPAGGDWRDVAGVLEEGQARREVFRRAPVTDWATPLETVVGPGGSAPANVADPRIALEPNAARHRHKLEVLGWEQSARTVTATPTVGGGAPSVADPRFAHADRVTPWSEAVGTVTSSPAPSSGGGAVADPRWGGGRLGVTGWEDHSSTVTGESYPSNGRNAIADPRFTPGPYNGSLGVSGWNEPAGTVTGNGRPQSGRFSVADPRFADGKKKNWQQVSGVTAWTEAGPTVTSNAKLHAGPFQVADPRAHAIDGRYRIMMLAEARALDLDPKKAPPFIPIIIAEDGTWHRPLTTLELAVLQSFPAVFAGRPLVLAGNSHTRWRQGVGNAVPPDAAESMSEQMLLTLLLAELGVFSLSNNAVWVAPNVEAMVA